MGGEYFSDEWKSFCEENEIRHEHTIPYNPQQNGITERKNQTLLDACRSMIQVSGLPLRFWQQHVTCKIYHHIRYLVLKHHNPFGLSINLTLVISEYLVRSLIVMYLQTKGRKKILTQENVFLLDMVKHLELKHTNYLIHIHASFSLADQSYLMR